MPGGLRRGATVAITARGQGATSLLLALLAEPARAGAWCAVIDLPSLSLAAASENGGIGSAPGSRRVRGFLATLEREPTPG